MFIKSLSNTSSKIILSLGGGDTGTGEIERESFAGPGPGGIKKAKT